MELIIVHPYGEFKIYLDENYSKNTLYDILIIEKLLSINTLYNKFGKKIGYKIPLFKFKTNKLILFTDKALSQWKKYKTYQNNIHKL